MIDQVEGYVRPKAARILDELVEKYPDGECDFVEEVAAPLPLQIICEMMGIPESDEQQVFAWTNVILGVGDPDYAPTFDQLMTTSMEINQYALDLGTDRLAHPRDDITSTLMHAELDGDRLTTQEFASFFILLVVAGQRDDPQRHLMGHEGADRPPRRSGRSGGTTTAGSTKSAVEEIVRWATPVIHFRRTATADTQIRGVPIKEGDKVVLLVLLGQSRRRRLR